MNHCANCPFNQTGQNQCLFELHHNELRPFSFKRNEIIFSEKQSLKGIYCIKEGACYISKNCSNGKNQIIELLSRGTLLGIRSILCEEPTNLEARVIVPMYGCFLPKEEFLKLFRLNKDFSFFVTKELANYLKQTDDKIVSMGQKSMHQRVAEMITNLPQHFAPLPNGYIDVKMRREDLANFVGIATESLIRVFSAFNDKGWICTKGKQLKIIAPEKLKQFSEGHLLK